MKQSKMHLTVYGATGYLGHAQPANEEEPEHLFPCGVKVAKPQTNAANEPEVLFYTDGNAKLKREGK